MLKLKLSVSLTISKLFQFAHTIHYKNERFVRSHKLKFQNFSFHRAIYQIQIYNVHTNYYTVV